MFITPIQTVNFSSQPRQDADTQASNEIFDYLSSLPHNVEKVVLTYDSTVGGGRDQSHDITISRLKNNSFWFAQGGGGGLYEVICHPKSKTVEIGTNVRPPTIQALATRISTLKKHGVIHYKED
jgi:hypothetical protein